MVRACWRVDHNVAPAFAGAIARLSVRGMVSLEFLKIIAFIVASTVALMLAILIAARAGGGKPPDVRWVFAVAVLISAVGIPFGKYGENFGLPWEIYYTVPALATVLVPPLAFRFPVVSFLCYTMLALLSAPLIHIAFFYTLGWSEYMPFLKLPD